ncbi:MAG: NTP transferase domain-containing protein, partial [Bacteroidaceae bacterium]|nr:NTP transferase domain-containing protein [Bacteroidaceae bacterium]
MESMNNNNYCVILAGGKGTRLWPSSRQQKPKQFIDYLSTGETLLQSTYRRFSKFISKDNIIVVSNEDYRDIVMEQLPEL